MQAWAILVDSYRLVLSRKLFWITLIISGLVVLVYASIGFDETGWFFFFGLTHFEDEFIRAGSPWAEGMYLGIFSVVIVGFWLTWAATILALISTAPIFVDFMADGSIDLVLAKPLSRIKLFLVKYLGGLLFVLLQVGLFALGVFLCVGWRVGQWNWSIFSAIPLVVIFFSYLYGFNVLMNVLTRSSLASVLLTILFWFMIWGVQQAESVLNMLKLQSEITANAPLPEFQPAPTVLSNDPEAPPETEEQDEEQLELQRQEFEDQLANAKRRREDAKGNLDSLAAWHDGINGILTVVPKTAQTIGLLDRWITTDEEHSLSSMMQGGPRRQERRNAENRERNNPGLEAQKKLQDDYNNRSPWYIIGTSLCFEFVMLGFACWLFVRRDF